jgi:hypothetical protein
LWHSSIDRIGKDISGSGMDTDVIGRDITGYLSSLHPDGFITPIVARIFVPALTPASNGIGIGLADFTTARFLKALNLQIHLHERFDLARAATSQDPHLFRQ